METYLSLVNKIPVSMLLVMSAIAVISGDYFAKYWSVTKNHTFFILAILFYGLSAPFYVPTLLRQGLVITSIIWSLLAIVGFLIIGLFFFKETLTFFQWFGVMLGLGALVVLTISQS
jgi:multidrug transporter EmrE-like cation transporter